MLRIKIRAHYIYIKHLERLCNLTDRGTDKLKNFCPFCRKKVSTDFCKHLADCHRRCTEGTAVTLRETVAPMRFDNHKGKTVVHVVVLARFDGTLLKPGSGQGSTHTWVAG